MIRGQSIKYRIGLVMSIVLVGSAMNFDFFELILDLVGTKGGFVLVIIGYLKDFASLIFFPTIFFILGAPFWKGKKAKKKMIAMVTAFLISAIPWIGAVMPETTVAVATTIHLTRKEDREKAKEKGLVASTITRTKRTRPKIMRRTPETE